MSEEMQYSIHESARAIHVNLKISARRGLEVVVPRGFDCARIPLILEGRREWIKKTLARVSGYELKIPPAFGDVLPGLIDLPAIGETWRVEYAPAPAPSVMLRQVAPDAIRLSGAVESQSACWTVLKLWLRAKAASAFGAMLAGLVRETGLSFGRLTIRCQSSRWGSCSWRGDLSLNLKMLFLPLPQVRHILIHELCHTRYHNHSKAFRRLLDSLDPGGRGIRGQIRRSYLTLPGWI